MAADSQAAVAARIGAAVLGGYALAALASVACLALPLPTAEAVLAGMLTGFVVHALAAIWAFGARSAARAWAGILLAAASLALTAVAGGR